MSYLTVLIVFFLVLGGGIFVFLELIPETLFDVLARLRWGRELSLSIIFGAALGMGLLTLRAFQ
jgi:hypothetical protein